MRTRVWLAFILAACHSAPQPASVARRVPDGGPTSICEIDPPACPPFDRGRASKALVSPIPQERQTLDP